MVISGSCWAGDQGQVANFMRNHPAFQIEPRKLAAGQDTSGCGYRTRLQKITEGPVHHLLYRPAGKSSGQAELGREAAGDIVEQALARVADSLVKAGVH